jgi:hypothetical protein
MRYHPLALGIYALALLVPFSQAFAQTDPQVQEITGYLAAREVDAFRIEGLERGQTLYVFLETVSGNLDPVLAVVSADTDLPALREVYTRELQALAQSSPTPLLELPALRDRTFLAWDDDSGPGYSAALEFPVPEDGDYFLLTSGSLSAAGRLTYGGYRMLVGLDEPSVLDGNATLARAEIAVPDQAALGGSPQVQEFQGSLTEQTPIMVVPLYDLNPGDTLYLRLESETEGLAPVIVLRDYGNKPIRAANLSGQEGAATMQQSFPEGGSQYLIEIRASSQSSVKAGDVRLLAGLNAPDVLDGTAEAGSESVLEVPRTVGVGILLQEIVRINQQDEIMTAVGTIQMEWTDPRLAFNPDDCLCTVKQYTETSYNKFLEDVKGDWPDFTFFNQQGNRWAQNRLIEIDTSGRVVYIERFSTDFQLNFDWQSYPFDHQDFYIHVDMLYPEDRYRFDILEGFSAIDPGHGEDEFILSEVDTGVSSAVSSREVPTSRFTLHFSGPRHQEYYVWRIFIPIFLIICVSWITFFLKDYTRRIEVATGNLLLFIAFSFSLAENYPRMGYLTFLDALMAITFIINTLVVVYNVYLKWLETRDQRERADRIDDVMDWVYPAAFVVSVGIVAAVFL